jgi:hypothetical protein
MFRLVLRFGSVLFLGWLVIGCGKKPSVVSGQVTYEGQPVQSGYISFIPVDGQGGTSGGPILRGRYKVEDVKPGKVRVEIRAGGELAAMPEIDAPKQMPDPKGAPPPPPPPEEDVIPPDAVGNNETVDIGRGNQKKDFNLERPTRRKPDPAPAPGSPPKK